MLQLMSFSKMRFTFLMCFCVSAVVGCATRQIPLSPGEKARCDTTVMSADIAMADLFKRMDQSTWADDPRNKPIVLKSISDDDPKLSFKFYRKSMPTFPTVESSRGLGGYVIAGYAGERTDVPKPITNLRILSASASAELQTEVLRALETWQFRAGPTWSTWFGKREKVAFIQQMIFCPRDAVSVIVK
jgi:hypothetical protein